MARNRKWQCAEFILSFPTPFLVVLLECGCSRHLILNFLLCMCFWIPGMIRLLHFIIRCDLFVIVGVLHAMYFAVRRRPEVDSIQFRESSVGSASPGAITPSTTPIPYNFNIK